MGAELSQSASMAREAKKVFLELLKPFSSEKGFNPPEALAAKPRTRRKAPKYAPKALKGCGGKQEFSPTHFVGSKPTKMQESAQIVMESRQSSPRTAEAYKSFRSSLFQKAWQKLNPPEENERVQGFSVLPRTFDLQQCRKSCRRTGRSSGTCRSRPFRRMPSGSPC